MCCFDILIKMGFFPSNTVSFDTRTLFESRSHTLRGFEHLGEFPVVSFDLACKWAFLEYIIYTRYILVPQFFTIVTDPTTLPLSTILSAWKRHIGPT